MYKKFFMLLAFILLISSISMKEIVIAQEKATLSVSSSYIEQRGRTVTVGVFVDGADQLAGGTFELMFDPDVVQALELRKGDMLGQSLFVENMNDSAQGSIKVAWASADRLESSGTVIELDFRLLHRNRKMATDILMKNTELYDVEGKKIEINVLNGDIKPFKGDTKQKRDNISANKTWTINFDTAMKVKTLNKHTVYIIDNRTSEKVKTVVIPSSDKRSVQVKPVGNYSAGTYTIIITEQAQSINSHPLAEPVKLEFTVR